MILFAKVSVGWVPATYLRSFIQVIDFRIQCIMLCCLLQLSDYVERKAAATHWEVSVTRAHKAFVLRSMGKDCVCLSNSFAFVSWTLSCTNWFSSSSWLLGGPGGKFCSTLFSFLLPNFLTSFISYIVVYTTTTLFFLLSPPFFFQHRNLWQMTLQLHLVTNAYDSISISTFFPFFCLRACPKSPKACSVHINIALNGG